MDVLSFDSAKSLATRIQQKDVSSDELVEIFISRIEEVNPKLNAVVQETYDRALTEAQKADESLSRGESKGSLHGVPMTIKDSIETEGVVSTAGTMGRKSFVPRKDATVVARLRAAGAILLAKTNTAEITMGWETDNLVYGRTNNPYDQSRTSGGSSGGPAAIVAAGRTSFDLGSDTVGSIRVPSHFCGIAGLRPTTGRVPRTGHVPPPGGYLDSLTQIGPMARRVEDLALILPIISGPDWRDPSVVPMPMADPVSVDLAALNISFHTDNGIATPTDQTVAVVSAAAESLRDLGATVVQIRPTDIERSRQILDRIWEADGHAWQRRLLEQLGTTQEQTTLKAPFGGKEAIPGSDFSLALEEWDGFRSNMLSFMEMHDVIICPVNPGPALPHGNRTGGFAYTYSLAGWPTVVVRCGTSLDEGLPIGVQVVARPWREDVALAVAQHLESILGGWQPLDLITNRTLSGAPRW